MKSFKIAVVGLVAFASVGCNDQGDERLAEKARIEGAAQAQAEMQAKLDNMDKMIEMAKIEGKATAEAELRAQNDNLGTRSAEMESDLTTRQRFYQAVKGTYEGSLKTEQGEFNIRITLVPSLPAYNPNRTRTLEEVAADLTSLYFNAQVIQWNPANKMTAVGCRVEHVRPDLITGEINIASDECPNFYSFILGDDKQPEGLPAEQKKAVSGKLADDLRSGAATSVPKLEGEMRPTTNAAIYEFKAKKVRK